MGLLNPYAGQSQYGQGSQGGQNPWSRPMQQGNQGQQPMQYGQRPMGGFPPYANRQGPYGQPMNQPYGGQPQNMSPQVSAPPPGQPMYSPAGQPQVSAPPVGQPTYNPQPNQPLPATPPMGPQVGGPQVFGPQINKPLANLGMG